MRNRVQGYGWCKGCDEENLIFDAEYRLLHSNDLTTEFSVYCSNCGTEHTNTPLEYLKNTPFKERMQSIKKVIKNLNAYPNIWYAFLIKKEGENRLKLELLSPEFNYYAIKVISSILLDITRFFNSFNDKDAFKYQNHLKEFFIIKDNETILDTYKLNNFFLSQGLDVFSYPYNLD